MLPPHVRTGLRAMLPGRPPVLGRGDNADEGPRKLWAAEGFALHEHMPTDGQAHDGLVLTDGKDELRAGRTGFPDDEILPMLEKMRDLGKYEPRKEDEAAKARALSKYKVHMADRIKKGDECGRTLDAMLGAEPLDGEDDEVGEGASTEYETPKHGGPADAGNVGEAGVAQAVPATVQDDEEDDEDAIRPLPWRQ